MSGSLPDMRHTRAALAELLALPVIAAAVFVGLTLLYRIGA